MEGGVRVRQYGFGWLAAVGISLSLCKPAAAEPLPIQMHRAVYELSLGRTEMASDINGLDGRMVVEWQGGPACGGYTMMQRMVMRFGGEGGGVTSDSRLSTFETEASDEFSYTLTEYLGGELTSREGGIARRGKDGRVTLEREGEEVVTLHPETLFPIASMRAWIESMRRGDRIFEQIYFDGTEEKEKRVSVFVTGPGTSPTASGVKGGELLEELAGWNTHASYFDLDNTEGLPDFEMSFTLFANGVSSDLRLNYTELEIKARLSEITFFSDGPC
jgi:hypothetical protein